MRRASQVLFFIVIGGLIWGFSVRPSDAELGNKIIGFSVLAGAFVFMPVFLAHRWRGKKLSDYTLTQENLEKMTSRERKKK
jgi:hypothetical protein